MSERQDELTTLQAEAVKLREEIRAKLLEIQKKEKRQTPFGSFFRFGIGRRRGR